MPFNFVTKVLFAYAVYQHSLLTTQSAHHSAVPLLCRRLPSLTCVIVSNKPTYSFDLPLLLPTMILLVRNQK